MFDKAYLKLKNNNPRGVPDEYTYWGREDTIAEITSSGYFDISAFQQKEDPRRNLTDPPDTDAYLIHVAASDGDYEVKLVGGVATALWGGGPTGTVALMDTDEESFYFAAGGAYLLNTTLNGGTASLEVSIDDEATWQPVSGTLTEGVQQAIDIASGSYLRAQLTGGATVEVYR